MKISRKTIRDMLLRGDMPSLLRVFASFQREIAIKDELAEEYERDAVEIKRAYSEIKKARTLTTDACRKVEQLLSAKGQSKEFANVVARFGGLEENPERAQSARRLEELPEAVRAALEKLSD